jgi:Leucine-rich repeat (LRR) protein
MKKNYLLLLLICGFSQAQTINFSDPVFKAKLLEADITNDIAQDADNNNIKIDINSNGEIEQSEALLVYRLFYTANPPIRPGIQTTAEHSSQATLVDPITNVTGLSYFTNLRQLDLSNNQIEEIDLSGLSSLQGFNCKNSAVQSLDLSGLTALAYLNCSENELTQLIVSQLGLLQTLICNDNQLTQLFVAGMPTLQYLACYNNTISAIHFGGNPILTYVFCYSNQLTQVDLAGTSAVVLHCNDNPNLTTIKVKNNVDSPLSYFEFPQPPIDSFNFNNLPLLETVCCDAGEVSVMEQVLASQPTVGIATDCLPPNVINFADNAFKIALVTTNCVNYEGDLNYDGDADLNNDGEIDVEEALLMQTMSIGAANITDLDGLQYFDNLFGFGIGGNPLTHFDGYGLENLTNLGFSENNLTSVDLSGLTSLETFYIMYEPLAQVDFSSNVNLFFARFWNSEVTTLNFCGTALKYFDGYNLPNLTYFSVKNGIVTDDNILPQGPPPLSPIILNNTPLLETVCYDEGEYPYINWGDPIAGVNYVTDCPADCSILKTETFAQSAFAVYPNPANDVLYVQIDTAAVKSIAVVNYLGQAIRVLQNIDPVNKIDVAPLASGIYFIRIVADSGTQTQKFIKN